MEALNKQQAIEKFGQAIVDKAMASYAEPTSRVMYPAFEPGAHVGKSEYCGEPVETNGYQVTAYYYLTPEEEDNMDAFDWGDNVEFQIEETW